MCNGFCVYIYLVCVYAYKNKRHDKLRSWYMYIYTQYVYVHVDRCVLCLCLCLHACIHKLCCTELNMCARVGVGACLYVSACVTRQIQHYREWCMDLRAGIHTHHNKHTHIHTHIQCDTALVTCAENVACVTACFCCASVASQSCAQENPQPQSHMQT